MDDKLLDKILQEIRDTREDTKEIRREMSDNFIKHSEQLTGLRVKIYTIMAIASIFGGDIKNTLASMFLGK